MTFDPTSYLQQIHLPEPGSHKGQNGKLLIIGGSELFHAASKWSLDVASKFVDMVFYSSVPENNQLIKEAKSNFWQGIVVPRSEVEIYLEESDCVLIGPGMTREPETAEITNYLLKKYPDQKWVIDAGALQMADPQLFTPTCILTPHQRELEMIKQKVKLETLNQTTILLKGERDLVSQGETKLEISGGNPGMTKGGTGDVLAGLVAALYCTHEALTAAAVASYINKQAGQRLWQRVGPYFNASDLVDEIPASLWAELQAATS